MKTTQVLGAIFGLAGLAQAHMEMIYPAPFKSKANPFANGDVDYSMTSPLEASGSNFPCKGYLSLLGTDAGQSVATWSAGQTYNMTITGGANHGGGSCQASLSFDQGKTWSVIHSYIGNCPGAGTTSYDFTLPANTPNGDVVFAWTWFNQIGNREMYMNCASVTVQGGSDTKSLSDRPAMFVANVNNGCSTKEGSDLEFPDPGADVSNDSSNTSPPVGTCASGSGSGSGSSASSSVAAAPATSQPASPATSAVAASSSVPGGVFITVSEPVQVSATAAPEVPTTSAPAAVSSAPAAEPSTLLTLTKSAASPTTPSASTSPAPTSGSGSGSSGAFEAGTACDSEGDWNCIGGTQFQRCASGQWSVVMSMAQGTTCESGQTSLLSWGKKRANMRRRASPWRV